jgi:hypothetical protein
MMIFINVLQVALLHQVKQANCYLWIKQIENVLIHAQVHNLMHMKQEIEFVMLHVR